jgi:predicted PurR-regulated permease PerM
MNLKLSSGMSWGVNLLFLLSVTAALYLGKRIFIPLVLALLLAAMLWPVVSWMSRRGVPAVGMRFRRRFPWIVPWAGRFRYPWSLASLVVVIGGVAVVFLIAAGFGVALSKFVIDAGNPEKVKEIYSRFREKLVLIWPADIPPDSPYFPVESEKSQVLIQIREALNNKEMLQRLGWESASFLWDAIILTFVLMFLLIEGPMLNRHLVRIFGPSLEVQSKAVDALTDMGNQIRAYVVWRTIINFALALFLGLLYTLLRLSQPWTWALISIVLFYVPYFGPILAGVGPVADAFISCDPWIAPALLIFYTVLVIIEGYWIVPVVMGRGMELNATTVLLACIFWEQIWGMAGLFLAMPLMAVIKTVCMHIPDWKPWSDLMGTTEVPPDPSQPPSIGDFLEDTQLMDSVDARTYFAKEREGEMKRPR